MAPNYSEYATGIPRSVWSGSVPNAFGWKPPQATSKYGASIQQTRGGGGMDPATGYAVYKAGEGIVKGILGHKRGTQDRKDAKELAKQQRYDAVQAEGFDRQVATRRDHWRLPFIQAGQSALQDLFPGTLPPMDPKAYDRNFLLSAGGGLEAQTFGEFNARERGNTRRFARPNTMTQSWPNSPTLGLPQHASMERDRLAGNVPSLPAENTPQGAGPAMFGQGQVARRAGGFLPQPDAIGAGASVGRMGDLSPVDERLANLRASGLARFNAAPTPSFGGGRMPSNWT